MDNEQELNRVYYPRSTSIAALFEITSFRDVTRHSLTVKNEGGQYRAWYTPGDGEDGKRLYDYLRGLINAR